MLPLRLICTAALLAVANCAHAADLHQPGIGERCHKLLGAAHTLHFHTDDPALAGHLQGAVDAYNTIIGYEVAFVNEEPVRVAHAGRWWRYDSISVEFADLGDDLLGLIHCDQRMWVEIHEEHPRHSIGLTILHEIAHAFGAGHSQEVGCVMGAKASRVDDHICESDVAFIKKMSQGRHKQ